MKTVMTDLKDDLIDTILTSKQALNDIIEEEIRLRCQQVVEITLRNIIRRIDLELLPKEREQIESAYDNGIKTSIGIQTADLKSGFKYYETTFKK